MFVGRCCLYCIRQVSLGMRVKQLTDGLPELVGGSWTATLAWPNIKLSKMCQPIFIQVPH